MTTLALSVFHAVTVDKGRKEEVVRLAATALDESLRLALGPLSGRIARRPATLTTHMCTQVVYSRTSSYYSSTVASTTVVVAVSSSLLRDP